MDGWLMLTPGTTVDKVVKLFEKHFGIARKQTIPCDASIQLQDTSTTLGPKEASAYRSVVGLCLYVGRERPDLMFTIKELACSMSNPTLVSVQRLRKLIGYMKQVGDVGLRLDAPSIGAGKYTQDDKCAWAVETFSDADW